MATLTKSEGLFNPELVSEVFTKVNGHSALAKLSAQKPVQFVGNEVFVFSLDGEAAIVGEGANKPEGEGGFEKVEIRPIKFVYQHRLTDEFINMSEEQQIPYLATFTEGFAKKMARALDIAAMHGVDPATDTAAASLANNNFDMAEIGKVEATTSIEDDGIDDAIQLIIADERQATGIAMSPKFASRLGKIRVNGVPQYPEFRFGQNPSGFCGMGSDVNSTVSFGKSKDDAIVGDFENAFRWGYAQDVPCEVIEYGDPDGKGDLKRTNEIVLRAEAYIGWGILDKKAFKKIEIDDIV